MSSAKRTIEIQADSELMKNQKHAAIMGRQQDFQSLQTRDGDAIFFSIGTDGIFYVTREARASSNGWSRKDLSSSTSDSGAGAAKAKSFTVSQDPRSLSINIACVMTKEGNDTLYLSQGNSIDSDQWATGVVWQSVPFDATSDSAPSPFLISDVYMLTQKADQGLGDLTMFVDIVETPKNQFKLLQRYYIEPESQTKWIRHSLPNDIEQGSISSCLGRREGDDVDGIYTLGKIGGSQSLMFKPKKDPWSPHIEPPSARFNCPSGVTALSSCLTKDGLSNLFVAADDGLFLFEAGPQKSDVEPTLIVPSSPAGKTNTFSGATCLRTSTIGTSTAVWGLNEQLDLIYTTCLAGEEPKPDQWSPPMRISSGVAQFAFYLNIQVPANVVFALIGDKKLLQLNQDPSSGDWTQRSITLPATELNEIFEVNTFTTHIKCTDQNGTPAAHSTIFLRAKQETQATVNGLYYKLSPDSQLEIEADITGTLTIIQETHSLSAATIQITSGDQTLTIDPNSKISERLSTVKSGSDLSKVRVTDSKGHTSPLVPSDVSQNDQEVVAKSLSRLLEIQSTLPDEGSDKTFALAAPPQDKPALWGVLSDSHQLHFVEDSDALCNMSAASSPALYSLMSSASLSTPADAIFTVAGDLFCFLKDAWEDVKEFVVRKTSEFWEILVFIGGKVYKALLNSVSAVYSAIEFLFNKIKVFFEKLVAWLGFMFNWGDILRSHRVAKNMIKLYAGRAVDKIDDLRKNVQTGFEDLRSFINGNSWQSLQDGGETIGQQQKGNTSRLSGADSPQSNWIVYHTNNGLTSAESEPRGAFYAMNKGAAQSLLEILEDAFNEEKENLNEAMEALRERVIYRIHDMSPIQAIQECLKILGTFLVGATEIIVLKLLDLVKLFVSALLDLLDAPLNIPIISPIYKWITDGDQLSCLDLVCLVTAIPGTLIYKLATNSVPFPDDPFTQSLIDASTFSEFSALLLEPHSSMVSFAANAPDQAAEAPSGAKRLTTYLKVSAIWVGAVSVGFAALKREGEISGQAVNYFAVALWFAEKAPGISANFPWPPGKWVIVGDIMMMVGLCKVLVDNIGFPFIERNPVWKDFISPGAGTILSAVALVPAIAGYAEKKKYKLSDHVGLTGSLVSCCGGMLSMFTPVKLWGPQISAAAIAISAGCSLTSSGMTAGSGVCAINEAEVQPSPLMG
ncbi:hypothetical protein CNMCM5623_005493 [Aspergillus felis]|uniref:Uncharacterized protein n=1 Tax=Aspergillus felis TaxID=1287682 RepID=A0A8H6QG82_9EURO|nr:hypothetical protein CNMCM5623_005493 [Aspergillus felis]